MGMFSIHYIVMDGDVYLTGFRDAHGEWGGWGDAIRFYDRASARKAIDVYGGRLEEDE